MLSQQGEFVEQAVIFFTSMINDDGEGGKNIVGYQVRSDANERVPD